jgi:hypothetical protein
MTIQPLDEKIGAMMAQIQHADKGDPNLAAILNFK